MNSHTASKRRRPGPDKIRLNFPEWEFLIRKASTLFQQKPEFKNKEIDKRLEYYLNSMDDFRHEYLTNPLQVLFNFAYGLPEKSRSNFIAGLPGDAAMHTLQSMPIGANEFYTLFEVDKNEYTIVDQRIREVLGVDPVDFNFLGLLGVKPNALQFHPADLCHLSRSALVAYMVICLPGFKWKAMHDYYRARARINVSKSKVPEISESVWMTLEKEVYMGHEETSDKNFVPVYHFKRWRTYPETEYMGTKPLFGGDPYQSKFRNVFWYLLHAYMLQIPLKYVLLLHERQTKDRHKSIALAINAQIRKYKTLHTELDDSQIADCFAKTIRQNIGEALAKWENLPEPVAVHSDIDAVTYAQKLGLLPVPPLVLELAYEHAFEA